MTPVIMKTVLVAFHSRTGHTAEVAQNIAAGLNADMEQLREAEVRAYFRAGLDALIAFDRDGAEPIILGLGRPRNDKGRSRQGRKTDASQSGRHMLSLCQVVAAPVLLICHVY